MEAARDTAVGIYSLLNGRDEGKGGMLIHREEILAIMNCSGTGYHPT